MVAVGEFPGVTFAWVWADSTSLLPGSARSLFIFSQTFPTNKNSDPATFDCCISTPDFAIMPTLLNCYQMRGIIQLMTLLTNFTQRSIFIIQSPPRHINWFVLVTKSCFSPPKDRRRPRSPAQTSSPCSHRSRSRSSRRRSASSTTTRTESSPPPTWKRPLRYNTHFKIQQEENDA